MSAPTSLHMKMRAIETSSILLLFRSCSIYNIMCAEVYQYCCMQFVCRL